MKKLETLSCTISLTAGGQSVSKAASIPFVNGHFNMKRELLLLGTTPIVSTF